MLPFEWSQGSSNIQNRARLFALATSNMEPQTGPYRDWLHRVPVLVLNLKP